MINKEEILKIKKIPGRARGQTIKNAFGCIELAEGQEGLTKLKEALKELNCWIKEYEDFKKIKTFKWYPLWQDIVPIILASDIFGWDEEKIRSFGRCNQKISFFEKTLLKYFVSIEQVLKLVPERWRKHYDQGELESVEFNLKEKHASVRLKNFSIHPVFCSLLTGYFESAVSFVVADKNPKGEEVKCVFRGDDCHEYIIRWN